jgi:F-type H+-transporting ATPase subunit gamma
VPSLKAIRKRISSVQSTQKITRAMKMVAGARLNKAQQRILELRPYAVKTHAVLAEITQEPPKAAGDEPALPVEGADVEPGWADKPAHPLLVGRPEKRVLLVVLTSDRGLCGAFNTNINKRAEREWRERAASGQEPKLIIIGRKGRDYMTRRGAPILEHLPGVWDKLGLETAQHVGQTVLAPFNRKEVDSIYLVYNEFKSAMSQRVVVERLLPVRKAGPDGSDPQSPGPDGETPGGLADFIYEPNKTALLDRLVPMYVDVSILRALYESQASELGARMTAMDSATKNAKEMIQALTLQYNKARQAAITKELMEIIGGSEALKE